MKHLKLSRLLFLIPLIMLILSGSGCKRKSVEQLLQLGRIDAAQKRCESTKAEERKDCCKQIALYLLKKGQFKKAAVYYAKAGEHIKVINSYFQGDLVMEAEKYCEEQTGETKKHCAARLGRKFFIEGDYQKSIKYYETSGDIENVSFVRDKIPAFQVVDLLKQKSGEIKDSNLSSKIMGIKKTLIAYIYLDRYQKWPYDKKSGPYKRAADIFENALNLLEDTELPLIIKTLTHDNFDWSQKSINALSFDLFQLENLIELIKHLHHIAEKKDFFTEYSVVFQDKSKKKINDPPQSLNYEEVYSKALDHSKMLLEEIKESNDPKNKEWLEEYKNDINIDIQIIDYLSTMVDNVKIRIRDIDKRNQKIKRSHPDDAVKQSSNKLFRDFIAQCNRVLHLISNEKYIEAKELLVSGYETAKAGIDQNAGKSKQ